MTTTGEPLPGRGAVWWVRVDKRRPVTMESSQIAFLDDIGS